MPTTSSISSIRIAFVGDLLLTTRPGTCAPGRGLEALTDEVRELFASCDIVLANLECTLSGKKTICTEPRVFTTEAQVRGLKKAGINVVTLGNNHTFDSFDEGFQRITTILNQLDIQWCGAGFNRDEASQPVIVEVGGITIAILGVVDASSGMNHFAGESASGVAPLELGQLCRQISTLRSKIDHVIVSPHWGDERFRFPSSQQIEQAHAFIDAGASMVLGHHPHVIQGMEFHQTSPIIYSLGNFFANHVYWDNGDFLTWNCFERTGCILTAELNKNGVHNVQQIPVFDNGQTISVDTSGRGERYLVTANQLLNRGISPFRFRREAFRVRTLLPILSQLRWEKLRRIRPGHFRKALRLFFQGIK